MQKSKVTTLMDIAREAGLSATAVSKALNGKGGLRPETIERVEQIAQRLKYTPNVVAKSLRLNRTSTIGVIVSDSSHSFFAKVVKGIDDAATERGYSIILCNTDQSLEKEKTALRTLINKRIDGVLFAASMLTGVGDTQFIEEFGVPFVFLIRKSESEDVDYVINDNVDGAYSMVSYLLKSGTSRIHFLNLTETSPSARDRLEGYKKALTDAGLPFDATLVSHLKPTIEDGYAAVTRLLDGGADPRTIFCGCDIQAIGVMEAIIERGLRIPEDIRVAAYDDIDFAEYLRVPLTTVRQPKYRIGRRGVEVLLDKIENHVQAVQHVVLRPELVIRQSA